MSNKQIFNNNKQVNELTPDKLCSTQGTPCSSQGKRYSTTINMVKLYQKGYVDGYRRHMNHREMQKSSELQYIYNILVFIIAFSILVVLSFCTFGQA